MKTTVLPYQKLELIQGSEEWKAERLKHITASNVPAIMGLSPYKTKLQYFEELMGGEAEVISDAKQTLFDIGHNAEAKGREYVEGHYGATFPAVVVISTTCPDLLASLDGFNEEHGVIFESKYVGRDVLKRIREEKGWLPAHHECQIQTQLLATGAKMCVYFVLDPDGEAAVLEIQPNPEYMRDLAQAITQFMAGLREGKAPEPSDRDWHTPADERFATLAELKRKADEAAAAFDTHKEQLTKEYEEYKRIRSGGVTVVRSVRAGNIQYAKIPMLKNVNLEQYRGKSSVSVTVRLEKKSGAA